MQELKRSGTVRYIGVSGYPLKGLQRALQRHSTLDFVSGQQHPPVRVADPTCACVDGAQVLSYTHHSLLDTSLSELIAAVPALQSGQVGLINASPLVMGLLSNAALAPGRSGLAPWHPAPAELVQAAKQAAAVCRERGTDLATVAVHFALSAASRPPQVASTLLGMHTREQLRDNLRAVAMAAQGAAPQLFDRDCWAAEAPADADQREWRKLLEQVRALLAAAFKQTGPWPSGRPENN